MNADELSSRRRNAGLFRFFLIVIVLGATVAWVYRRLPRRHSMRLAAERTVSDSLGAGDVRIYNADSAVDLVLQGNQVLAGLSPKTVGKVRTELKESTKGDTAGIGGSIANIVKSAVADNIGTHAAFPVAEIK